MSEKLERADLLSAEDCAKQIGDVFREILPPGWGFFLCLASYGEEGFVTYISNIEREGVGGMMLELLERWKKDPDTWANITRRYEEARARREKVDG